MKKDKLGIALIGAGRAGMIHGKNFCGLVPHASLAAVVDPLAETARNAAAELEVDNYYTDYRQVLADDRIDAVVVVTPTRFHCEIVEAAAKAGKHILCEKPMAMTLPECRQMILAAEQNHVKLQIGFMRRFDSSFVEAKRLVENGAVGQVVMIRSHTRGPSVPQPWMYDLSQSNGPLAEVNSHDIDTLRWFAESEFRTIYAAGGNYRCPDAKRDYPDFYDNVIVCATFENGRQGMLDGAQGVRYGYDARVEILGTEGCIFLGKTRENGITVCSRDQFRREEFVRSWRFLFQEAYLEEDRSFVSCILQDTPPLVTGWDGAMAVNVVQAGNRSIREKCMVTLEQEWPDGVIRQGRSDLLC